MLSYLAHNVVFVEKNVDKFASFLKKIFFIRDMYRCARSSDWGDQLPILKRGEEDIQSDSES